MIDKIHLDPKLEKCLASLKKGSRRACLAADRVETIVAELKRGKTPPGAVCTFTRNGEGRIKGCRKYDLGAGYRLVTLKQNQDLYLLYAGTHDECARWIENNRDHLPLEMITERSRTIKRAVSNRDEKKKASFEPSPNRLEEDWLPPIDDRDLRMIFSGLVESRE